MDHCCKCGATERSVTPQPEPLTRDETNAIRTLRRLAKRWPSSLMLFSASGRLHVFKISPEADYYNTPSGGADRSLVVATIEGIRNDGGDW